MFDIWLFGAILSFFILGVVACYKFDINGSIFIRWVVASLAWPVTVAVLVCIFIAEWIKAITNDSGNY